MEELVSVLCVGVTVLAALLPVLRIDTGAPCYFGVGGGRWFADCNQEFL